MAYAFQGSQLQKVLKDMGQADLQVLVSELLPALEEVVNELSPASLQAGEAVVEAAVNPALQAALASLAAKIQL